MILNSNNTAEAFIRKATKVFEGRSNTFSLPQKTAGFSFTTEDPRELPAGEYVVIEKDTRDYSRLIVINKKTLRMYSISKKSINTNSMNPSLEGGGKVL